MSMTYPILDLPSLTQHELGSAAPLTFDPFYENVDLTPWDELASVKSNQVGAMQHDLFSFTAVKGVTYYVFSTSYLEPTRIIVYDNLGRPIGADNETDGSSGMHYLPRLFAEYSGTMYVDAGWNQGQTELGLAVSLKVFGDVDTKNVAPPPVLPPVSTMTGTAWADRFVATRAEDLIDGGGGIDTVAYAGTRASYNIIKDGDKVRIWSIPDTKDVDTLRSVEKLSFSDGSYDMQYGDLTQSLYVAYFGRAADVGALKSFQSQLAALGAPANVNDFSARYAKDASVKNLIDSFGLSHESKALYSGDNKAFVKAIYNNLLSRDADQGGLDFWSNAIDSGSLTRANASLSILAGAQGNTSAQGLADALLLQKKISVAANFTLALETFDKGNRYDGDFAAGIARKLLGAVTTTTDAFDFQDDVIDAMFALPPPRGVPDQAREMPFAAHEALRDAPVIELTGVGGIADAFMFA
ncbi:DUF4214 domain-containing protein [Massilia sp. CCM 8692]|uniref:DUF4214 domain-containing protein n=2 Tax=Massilia rubra TaxID=2607910 RepID=A0ABX0LGV7_9BURK|nr:DUF4214 domain-containing protein [Massilia rubra]